MGLTNNQKQLIEEVAKGDMGRIKQYAIACLAEDNTSKNKSFCQAYLKRLKNQPTLIELPANLHQLAIAEDVSLFNERRYYISSREREIIENIKRSVLVSQKMLELGIRKSNATLFHGKSGTGKTTFAKYIAKTLDLPFIYLNFTNLIDSYMGKTSQNIGRVFQFANANRCVLMLDEIDCISIERGSSSGEAVDGEMSRITISLMQELDKISNQAIIIAATNRLDRIDKALIRRFSKVHEVKKLTDAELETLKNNYLMDIGIELSEPVSMEVKNQSEMITNINAMIEKEIENSMINNPESEYQLNLEMFGTPKLSSNF